MKTEKTNISKQITINFTNKNNPKQEAILASAHPQSQLKLNNEINEYIAQSVFNLDAIKHFQSLINSGNYKINAEKIATKLLSMEQMILSNERA